MTLFLFLAISVGLGALLWALTVIVFVCWPRPRDWDRW